MQAGIIPDHAHRPRRVAYRNAREVVHRETVIAGNECGLQRFDVNRLGGCWSRAGRARQRQARGGDEVHHVLHWTGGAWEAAENGGSPIVLVCHIDIACLQVYGRVCALVLAPCWVGGSHDEVRSSRGACASDASVAAIVTGRTCRVTEVADREFDGAGFCKGDETEKELCVGHIQSATHGVNRQELFVKEAAEGEAEEGLALRANRSYGRLAAAQCGR